MSSGIYVFWGSGVDSSLSLDSELPSPPPDETGWFTSKEKLSESSVHPDWLTVEIVEEYEPAVFSEPSILYVVPVMEYDRPSGRSENEKPSADPAYWNSIGSIRPPVVIVWLKLPEI